MLNFLAVRLGLAALVLSFSASAQSTLPAGFNPADLVNPLMGTDSKPSLSNGNTYPAISRPWGMNV